MNLFLDIVIFGICFIIMVIAAFGLLDLIFLNAHFTNKLRRKLGEPDFDYDK